MKYRNDKRSKEIGHRLKLEGKGKRKGKKKKNNRKKEGIGKREKLKEVHEK